MRCCSARLPRLLLAFQIAFGLGCYETHGPSPLKTVEAVGTPGEVAAGIELDRYKSDETVDGSRVSYPHLQDVAPETGPDFTYLSGATGQRLMVEATGAGVAWTDFDRDGWCDVFCVQGGRPDVADRSGQPSDQLFRNQSSRFIDASGESRIEGLNYGQGVTAGDFDNDGFDDLFVTGVGPNSLWRNLGDGTFESADCAVSSAAVWSTSAAWADLDLDGNLDLYVGNYCDFDPLNPVECRNPEGVISQCQPREVAAVPDEVFLNPGDGTFRECARELGLAGPDNRTLGVVIADFFQSGSLDIYVANDATANFFFRREDDGKYTDRALRMGCAYDAHGRGQASMGVALGDFDSNGLPDLYLTHFEGEWNTLYSNQGPTRGFVDVTGEVGLLTPTIPWVGFGTVMADLNLDGAPELFVANGHIDDLGRKAVLSMPPQLFTFDQQRWHDVGQAAGDYFARRVVGRGCAESDFDNDGDLDIAVIHQNEPLSLLQTDSQGNHWLRVRLVGCRSNRTGLGAVVTVTCGELSWTQQMISGGSYCSSRQPLLVFGLGTHVEPCRVEVRWPQEAMPRQIFDGVPVNQTLVVVESYESATAQ